MSVCARVELPDWTACHARVLGPGMIKLNHEVVALGSIVSSDRPMSKILKLSIW